MKTLYILILTVFSSCQYLIKDGEMIKSTISKDSIEFDLIIYKVNNKELLYTWPKNNPDNYTVIELKTKN